MNVGYRELRDQAMSQDCQYVRARLLDLLEDAVSDDAEGAVYRHLDACDACSAELDELRGAWARLVEPTPVRPSSAIRARLLSYARSPQPGRARPEVTGPAHRWLAGAALLAVASAVILGIRVSGSGPGAGPDADPPPGGAQLIDGVLLLGERFPKFAALDVASGDMVSLTDLEGDIILLNVWATWCAPCEQEMPSMERLYRELGSRGLSVVAVSVDQESTNKVRQWVDERGFTFTVLHDREGRFERTFQTVGVPESFVIDRDGVLVAREIGPRLWDSPEAGAVIRQLVGERDR